MEMLLCFLGGFALVACGVFLSRFEPPNWAGDVDPRHREGRSVARWSAFQVRIRRMNNFLLMLIGAAIASTGAVPHGNTWLVLWFTILVALLVCILLACLDAFSSLAGYKNALPEAARRSLGRSTTYSDQQLSE